MSEQDLIRTIQFQQNQINQLKGQLNRLQGINFQQKYRKALREIHGIINANRQLKQELDKLKSFRGGEAEAINQIQKEQFTRTHQKLLKDKNLIYSEKEALQLDNEKLRYSIAALEETVSKLKNDKMALARQREADQRFGDSKSPQKNMLGKKNEREQQGYRDKEAQLRRTIENYEEHHATISRTNRRLEEENNELENKIFNMETQYKNKLNQKDIELKELKSVARQEYQGQIANLRKQLAQLKIQNSELSIKIQYYAEESQNKQQSQNLYEKQFLQTLRDLKIQMEPMSYQISELQEKNQFEKRQSLREKTSLQLKTAQLESQLQRFKEHQKILEQKLIREIQKNRKYEQTEKTIRKLEEQNRMLGGRVIVLQSKQVALRNRNGDELEERVMEFQTRVQMLLADKETIGNMKNVGIHQLIALKAYIMELDGRLKQVVNQNEYAVKKYRSYKEKCAQLIRELKQHDIAINSLKGKLQGYDRLVVKLQGQLERAITINDNEMKEFNTKISQTSITSIEIYRKKYDALVEKLHLQQKYSQQQIQTLKLNYETKIVDLNLKLEELNQIKDTIGLYKSKNEQLSNKLLEKENQLIQTRITKINIPETIPQPKINSKEIIQKLNDTISTKEAEILKLQNQVKSIEIQWKSKYSQIQQSTSSTISKKNKTIDDKENTIFEMESQLKLLRKSNADLENKILGLKSKQSSGGETVDLRKFQHVNSKISELQIQIESLRAKNEIQLGRINKMIKNNQELSEANNNLEAEVTRLKFEGKKIQKQLKMELQEKQNQIRRLKIKASSINEEDHTTMIKSPEIDNYKINGLKMDLEMLESQYQQVESDKNRYYNRTIQLEKQVSALAIQIDELNYSLQRLKNNANNQAMLLQSQKDQKIETLQYQLRNSSSRVRDLEEEINAKQNEITKLKNDYSRQKQRLTEENEIKEGEINRISRELSKIKFELTSQQDAQSGVKNELQYKLNRVSHENTSLRDQIQNLTNQCSRMESEIRFLKGREQQINNNLGGQEEYIGRLSNQIKNYQNRQADLEEEIHSRDQNISKLKQQISYYKSELENVNQTLANKDSYLGKLNADINGYRNKEIEWEMELDNKETAKNRLQSELTLTKNQIQALEDQIENLQRELNRLRYSLSMNDQQNAGHQAILEEKQMIISRLQGDLRIKSDHINELTEEIDNKNSKIAELQNESFKYRTFETDFESQLMEKNNMVSRLNFELSTLRARYNDLESQTQIKDGNWHNLNRELTSLKSQIDSFQTEMGIKDSNIDRLKKQCRQFSQQIERLNDQVFSKNTQINTLNQQIFKLKMDNEDKSNEQITSLENQIFRLKNKCSNLEGDLEFKEEQLMRAKTQMSKIRTNITTNRYSDDEYDALQNQYFQLQKSSAEARRKLEEDHEEEIRNWMRKQQENRGLQQNMSFYRETLKSLQEETTKYISSIEKYLNKNIIKQDKYETDWGYLSEFDKIGATRQSIIKMLSSLDYGVREYTDTFNQNSQQLWMEINVLKQKLEEAETRAAQNFDSEKELQEKDWGLHLYTNEVDRLRNVEQELKYEVESLKIKLSEYSSQESRILENLTIMTLTFAEVEAMRQRMIAKQNQIKQVRKSLVNFAGSIEEINRRTNLNQGHTQTSIDNHPATYGMIANNNEQLGNKASMNYRETDGSTNRGLSNNYEYELKLVENQNKQVFTQNAQESSLIKGLGQSLEQMSLNVQQRRLESEEQENIQEQPDYTGREGYIQTNNEEFNDQQNEKPENVSQQNFQSISGNSQAKASQELKQGTIHQGAIYQESNQGIIHHHQTQQINQGVFIQNQSQNAQFYQQKHQQQNQYQHHQPMIVHGGPIPPHMLNQQPMVVQRVNQPRVNFGGSVNSSFEQTRTNNSYSASFNYGPQPIRNVNPAYPVVNMSR